MCTDFLIVAADKTAVNGRSMEFGLNLDSKLLVRAVGDKFQSPSPKGLNGLSWTAKYGYVGLTARDFPVVVDGMNTQGLSTGSLWLPGSSYPPVTNPSLALALEDFVGWVLGNFATVAEVQSALTQGQAQVWEGKWMTSLLPLHFPIHDAQGNSIVVEFMNGQVQFYPNPVGVLTNNPPFPMQLTNIGGYAGLTPWDAKPVEIGGQQFGPAGHGSGMMGLPGDSTPPSRFVRATYLKQYAQAPENAAEACNLAFHILNDVDIPRGTSRAMNPMINKEEDDYTQWVVVKDLTNKVLYTRFYGNMCVYSVNLSTLDFSQAAGKEYAVPSTPTSIDITSKLTT
ncbi:MAG TPA: choloylglycine hydrolase family protein [Hyalangium sp.]|nr:choloylglycine hydrolase family protein [Hyalangium sp.]